MQFFHPNKLYACLHNKASPKRCLPYSLSSVTKAKNMVEGAGLLRAPALRPYGPSCDVQNCSRQFCRTSFAGSFLPPPCIRLSLVQRIWWRGLDSNQRRLSRQIYSLIPLATREPLQILVDGAGCRNRTGDLLITSQLLYQLS